MAEPTKKLVVDFPAHIKDKLDEEARRRGTTIKALIIEALSAIGIK